MRSATLFASALALCLAACGRAPEAPAAPEVPLTDIAAADEIAGYEGDINGVAFWTHPGVPFNGLVLAATQTGLVANNIEDGEEVSRIDGFTAGGAAITYAAGPNAAQGYAAVYDESDARFRFFRIDNASRGFSEVPLAPLDTPAADGFCLGLARTGERRLYALSGGAMQAYVVSLGADEIGLEPAASAQTPPGARACAVDDIDGAVFVLTRDGDIYRYTEETGFGVRFAASGAAAPAAIGLAFNGLVEGGPADQCCGQIAVLDARDATVRLFDREEGRPLGAVRLMASFDVEGVGAATAMGLGYGNFGGIYRDGVLALATDGERPALRLAPFNGVMDAVGAPIGESANPRAVAVQAEAEEDDGFVIDLGPFNP